MLLLSQMSVLFVVMMVGFIAYKKKVIDDYSCKRLSGIVINIASPAMVLSSITGEERIPYSQFFWCFFLAVVVYALLLVLAELLPRLLKVPVQKRSIYRVMTVFSNIGFMGFPVISAMYGKEALLYASTFLLPYNILIYTYGIQLMCADKTDKGAGLLQRIKKIFNIGVVASLVTMVIYFAGIPLTGPVEQVINMLGNLTAPLSMMVIGASFCTMDMKSLFTDVRLLIFSLVKLLVIPIAATWLFGLFVKDAMMLGVMMLMFGMPVGSMTAMLAQEYESDYELASRGVAITTILSIVTIPIVSAVCSWF